MGTADESNVIQATRRIDADDARSRSDEQQRAFENRLRAIASNAVLGAMACYGRTVMTDDDAARVDAIEKILVLPRANSNTAYPVVVPIIQTAAPAASALLQSAVEQAATGGTIEGS